MGKRKFNAKGRQVVDTIIDDRTTKQIKLDIPDAEQTEYGGYDQSNALVLPSEKRNTKIKKEKTSNVTRILSKKQRKNLEKVVDKKKKKEGRASLLDKLAFVQLPSEELKKYTSIVNVQTKGLKNHLKEKIVKHSVNEDIQDSSQRRWSSVSGGQRKKRLALLNGYAEADDSEDEKQTKNYNVVGIDQNSSSDDSENEESPVEATKKIAEPDESKVVAVVAKEIQPPSKPIVEVQPTPKIYKPTVYVHVERSKEIQVARLKLPILSEEQTIMETINENTIIILTGETGSGKTTQVPQFLYEAGYAETKMIGITEPRRVAAISMSKRVATEMNLGTDVVSYLIRFEGNVTNKTKIKFMTDGVLVEELENDFSLSKYSVIILDEAHERSVYTDILVGLLSRIVLLRQKRGDPLKLIIMSATLRVEDFTKNQKLFKSPPPVLTVETRQFPVTIHFNKRTSDDYVKDAYNKAIKIHNKLPEGGILIFLTGQQEVNHVVKKLRKAFPYQRKSGAAVEGKQKVETNGYSDGEDSDEMDMKKAIKNSKKAKKTLYSMLSLPQISLDDYKLPTDDTDADLLDDSSIKDDDSDLESENEDTLNLTGLKNTQPLWVLPLYSLLPSEKQSRVFEKPPEGTRLCVVSTNVAETSLTIPNVKYVIDAGRQKTRLYDKVTGVSSFVVTFTSKAAANQRAGRAGRTAPGHCYRLYSSAVYDYSFDDIAVPDIQKKPVDDLMLQMKCMGIDKVINFPFPSPPDLVQLQTAEYKLKLLGAIESVKTTKSDQLTKVTPLGHAISAFPVAPRFGKMLALSHQHSLLPYTVCMVAALSVQEVLVESGEVEPQQVGKPSKWTAKRKLWAGSGNSLLLGDPVVLLRAVGAAEYANSMGNLTEFCRENGLRPKAVAEIRKLRIQLTNEINLNVPDINLCVDPKMTPPSDMQAKLLRQILLSGLCDQVARLIPDDELNNNDDRRKFKYAYKRHDMEDPVFLHSSSVLRSKRPGWVVYQEIYELQNGNTTKIFMRGVTAIEAEWLLIYANALCNIKSMLEEPMPRYNETNGKIYCYCKATFGKSGWEIPMAEIEMPMNELAFKYFAMFFLNGEIFASLKAHKKLMRSLPKNVVKSWGQNTPHILSFINALVRQQVFTKQKLLDVWKKDKFYLLQEYRNLLIDSASDIDLKWPAIELK